MKIYHALAALIAGSFAVTASAQNLKPGLWEITSKVQGAGMDKGAPDMQQQMANMSPQQRKMVEEMMAKQGVTMGAHGSGGMSVRTCMTPEMAERNEIPAQQGDCKTTKQQRSGNTINVAFSCASPPSSGEGQFTIQSPEAYTMKMGVNSTGGSKPRTVNVDSSGKWIATDCGSVKPMQAPSGRK